MLKPFKSLLTYLQKNATASSASSASFFGSREEREGMTTSSDNEPQMEEQEEDSGRASTVEELEVDRSLENVSGLVVDDPLSDPLAIDQDFVSIIDAKNPDEDEDEVDTGQIVFVDINKLKENVIEVKPYEVVDRFKLAETTNGPEDGESRSDGSDSGLGSEQLLAGSCNTSAELVATQKSALKRKSGEQLEEAQKRPRRSVHFEKVTIYYFPRTQGFVCVPSQGGCTLGMGSNHTVKKSLSLAEHVAEQRRANRLQLEQGMVARSSSSEDTESDEEPSDVSESDLDAESSGFLQPVSTKQRRALLKAAGIRKIETSEKDECRIIRTSREVCGCNCRGFCDPDTCSCSRSGIKCQVDRPSFPCGCTRDGCANVIGRVEFNPIRVRTHFIHTIMRLELEKKQLEHHHQLHSNHIVQEVDKVSEDGPSSSRLEGTHGNYINEVGTSQTEIEMKNVQLNDSLDFHYAYRDEYDSPATTLNHNATTSKVSSITDLSSNVSESSSPNNDGPICSSILTILDNPSASTSKSLSAVVLLDESGDLTTPQFLDRELIFPVESEKILPLNRIDDIACDTSVNRELSNGYSSSQSFHSTQALAEEEPPPPPLNDHPLHIELSSLSKSSVE